MKKIVLQDQEISESSSQKILGVKVRNDLSWSTHIQDVRKKVNYGLYILKRMKSNLCQKSLRALGEGLVMSHIRYCIPLFLSDKARISEGDPVNQELQGIQTLQNKMLRIILGVSLRDKIPTKTLLQKVNMLSINQMVCMSTLMETWSALNLGVDSISCHFKRMKSLRFSEQLQGTKDPKSFVSCAARLYNMTNDGIKMTNLTKKLDKKQEAS